MKMPFKLALIAIVAVSLLTFMSSSKPSVIIMLGAPGAGKGTQAGYISEKHHLPQISTGDLFRDNLGRNTEIGKKAKSYMEKGALVPDEIVLAMLFDRISQPDCKNGYILDGFPRTIPQADALQKELENKNAVVLSIELPDELIIERLAGRIVCEKCGTPYHVSANPPKNDNICDKCGGKVIQRNDDKEDVIRKRLTVFHEQTEPLKEYYQNKEILYIIDGTGSKEKTTQQIESALKKAKIA